MNLDAWALISNLARNNDLHIQRMIARTIANIAVHGNFSNYSF